MPLDTFIVTLLFILPREGKQTSRKEKKKLRIKKSLFSVMDLKHYKLGKFEQRQKTNKQKKTKAKKRKTMVTEMRDPALWKTHGKSPREGN